MYSWLPPRLRALPGKQSAGVQGDHQLFIRGDNPGADAAVRTADARAAAVIGRRIQLQPEPGSITADTAPDGGGILADAAGEHEGVEAAECRGQRPQFAADAVEE